MPSTRPRYIELATKPPTTPQEKNQIKRIIRSELIHSVQRVQRHMRHRQYDSRQSVYLGNTGIALMEYRLSSLLIQPEVLAAPSSHNHDQNRRPTTTSEAVPQKEDALSPRSLMACGDERLAKSLGTKSTSTDHRPVRDTAHASFLETEIGSATLVLTRALWSNEETIVSAIPRSEKLVQSAIDMIDREDADTSNIDEDGCEVLYGRAGLLYALLSMRKTLILHESSSERAPGDPSILRHLSSDATLSKVIDSIIIRGKHGSAVYAKEMHHKHANLTPPLMWIWHGKRYLGGAHGIAGILHILLSAPDVLIEKHALHVAQTVEWILGLQDASGNWPTQAPGRYGYSPGENDLVQWCHGAPGILMLLSAILRCTYKANSPFVLSSELKEKITTSLHHGTSLVYRHGLLRKGVGLCHGTAGSVYALLAVSDVLDIDSTTCPYFTQAVHLAHLATYVEDMTFNGDMKTPDHPWSLYEGLGGMCCAWGEVLSRFETNHHRRPCSGMPGFDDLHTV